MWRELVKMYSMIDAQEFKPIDLIIIKKRLSDINKVIEKSDSIEHLRNVRKQYHDEILEMSRLFSNITLAYRKNKLKNELKKHISEFHKINEKERKKIVKRYSYLTTMNGPIFSENTISRLFIEDFMSRIEKRKLELFFKGMEKGKRIIVDKENTVIIHKNKASVIPTRFMSSILDLLYITKNIKISEVPVVLDIKKGQKKLKVTINERIVNNNTICSKERNIYIDIPKNLQRCL